MFFGVRNHLAGDSSYSEWGPAKKALWFLAGATVAVVFLAGISFLFYPQEHSRITGCFFLAVTAPLMYATMHRWLGGLLAVFVGAIFLGVLAIASGRIQGAQSPKITPSEGVVFLLFFFVSGVLVWLIGIRELSAVDRTAVMVYLFAVGWTMAHESAIGSSNGYVEFDAHVELPVMAVAIGVLGVACLFGHFHGRKHRHRHPAADSDANPDSLRNPFEKC